jgi:HD superfamily phosphodiesterase
MIIDSSIRRSMKPERPEWLTALQNDLALITTTEAQKFWPNPAPRGGAYYNYRLEHVQQVERDALRIGETLPVDQEILLAAVWLHDRFHPQVKGDQHAVEAAGWALNNLAGLGFPTEKVERVSYAVARHIDPPGQIPAGAVEARVLWDADKLSKIGPLDIVKSMLSHNAFPEQRISYTALALLGLEKLERSRRLVENLYYERSRQLAHERYQMQKAFYEAFARDVEVFGKHEQ